MKHRISITLEVVVVGLLLLSAGLSLRLIIISPAQAIATLVMWIVFLLAVVLLARQVRQLVSRWIGGAFFEQSNLSFSLANLSTPIVMISGKTVLWYNAAFLGDILEGGDAPLAGITKILPGFDIKACSSEKGQYLKLNGRAWHLFASTTIRAKESVTIVYLTEETKLRNIAAEYRASRPGCLMIAIDGYTDVFGDLLDSERARLLEGVNRILEEAIVTNAAGVLRRFASGQYIAVVEERYLAQFAQARYDLLDKIRALDDTINLSVSIGVGRSGNTFQECHEMAVQALDMAQGRGGDQAAEKTADGFSFYGGVSHGVEKRSKVKTRLLANALVDLIKQSESVVIMGHRMSDLDAVGAAQGVLRICKTCNVPAVIALRREATLAESVIKVFEDAGCADDFIAPEKALDAVSHKTLCVVVDTYQEVLVESRDILKACKNVVVIDHHRKAPGHIDNVALVCHEPYASSASELVCELLQYVGGKDAKPTRIEAEAMLAGIMLDTRNFSLHTGVRTFEAAAVLRRYGAETERVKALFNTRLDEYLAKCKLVENTRHYKNCAISLGDEVASSMPVAVPQAANDLLSIDGVEASFVAVKKGNGINISARSMGTVNVQVVMEALGGGGHQTMAGAQLNETGLEDAYKKICAAIDLYRAAQNQSQKKG
ncbi:MAG: DHH family phosphoesterase [Faecalibacterium sp.]